MDVLINILGGVAFLIWGTYLVRTNILRAYGPNLRRTLARSIGNRFTAFLAGVGVTSLVQSGTATALMTASFVREGLIKTAPGLAIMLGADVGSSLVAQVLSFDLSWLSSGLILFGVVFFMTQRGTFWADLGRVSIGLGIMLLALHLITSAVQPVVQSAGVKVIFASLTGEPVLDLLVGALLTMVAHSSLAVVLLIVSLVQSGGIATDIAFLLVLGANLGGALPPLLGTMASGPEAKRVPLGNLIFRIVGCLLFFPFIADIGVWLSAIDPQAGRQTINLHVAFNLCLAAGFIFFIDPIAALCDRLLPKRAIESPSQPRYLDPSALDTPSLALGNAAREVLRIADVIEKMLRDSLTALTSNDNKIVADIEQMDDIVDELYKEVKSYLTKISREDFGDEQRQRWTDIISFTINLEHIGDIVDKSLMFLIRKKNHDKLNFSEAGMAEIAHLHSKIMHILQLALNVFISGDVTSARRLLEEKIAIRDLERAYAESHFKRLLDHTPQSIETSAIHLDVIRDLRRIGSHICSVGYPVLDSAGIVYRRA